MAVPIGQRTEDDVDHTDTGAEADGTKSSREIQAQPPLRTTAKRATSEFQPWQASGSLASEQRAGSTARRIQSPYVVKAALALVEALALSSAGVVSFEFWSDSTIDAAPVAAVIIALTVVVAVWMFRLMALYNLAAIRRPFATCAKAVAVWATAVGLSGFVVATITLDSMFSSDFNLHWAWLGATAIGLYRLLLRFAVARPQSEEILKKRIVVIGGGGGGEEFIRALEASNSPNVVVVGIVDDRDPSRLSERLKAYPFLGRIDDLVEMARTTRIDLAIITFPLTSEDRLLEVASRLWVLPVHIRIAVTSSRLRLRPRAYSYLGNVALLDYFDRPVSDWDYIQKATLDRLLTLCILPFASVLMMVISLAIKLDSPGPVFFVQPRHGFNNRVFNIFKFRTMYADKLDYDAVQLVTENDPRVTRVGRFLRRTSLDELPQFINVLLGDLSLVGPRPHALNARAGDRTYQDIAESYFARHRVKPGITGWAQINGWRGETDTADKLTKRVDHDLYYIENWSVMFDLYILIKTPIALLRNRKVY